MAEFSEFINKKPDTAPVIYAYSDTNYPGCLKVGYTSRTVKERMNEHYPTLTPKKPWKIELVESAMKNDGSAFTDHQVHRVLEKNGIRPVRVGKEKSEWFECSIDDVKNAIIAVREGRLIEKTRTADFKMRAEQKEAVKKTKRYFTSIREKHPDKTPKFLWNAKMRFGKTFAAYQLAKEMEFKKILVLTFKPAVQSAWQEDIETHIDFEGWQFIANSKEVGATSIDEQYKKANKSRPIVCFGSFQDFLQKNEIGGIKAKNEWVHTTNWDLVIFDEYHFGAWRDNAKKLFEIENEETEFDAENYQDKEAGNAMDESFLPITADNYLFLSGTPFRAISTGEFLEEAIFTWSYSDEQNAKENWNGKKNPYAALPRMIMLTYQVPESINQVALQGEFNEFDLNEFFAAEGSGDEAKFKYENEVQKWLNLIRGAYQPSAIDDLKLGQKKRPPMPFSDVTLLNELSHTVWFLPGVSSCYAMKNLLSQKVNKFYADYRVIVCAGTKAGVGVSALPPVQEEMGDPLKTKTITLTCGKLTTGVTVKPWSGIFMLRNLKSPETYFQAAFRVQSPWEIKGDNGESVVLKNDCYVFDFALDRALRQISDYSCHLSTGDKSPEKLVEEFIHFLPVLAYDGSTMKRFDAAEILDHAMSGTTATLLAKRWESALLVNVDNNTLRRILDNKEAYDALMKIEGFRSLGNNVLETIVNKSDKIQKAKNDDNASPDKDKKRELTKEEKEMKSLRKQVQEKLMKFATRIPIFMYLTDFREECLRDVVTKIDLNLFRAVTGLTVKDFDRLVSIGVFNNSLMNDAIFKFRRYEEASLSYTGLDMNTTTHIGGFDTKITKAEHKKLF